MRANPYETQRYLHEYSLLHYGQPKELDSLGLIPREWLRFHERLRQEYVFPIQPDGQARGLDLGCAVGRFSFELAGVLDEVIGLDSSRPFIQTARRMAKDYRIETRVRETGAQFRVCRLVLLKPLRRSRVEFRVGNAMDLACFPNRAFQVISAINLIDRLPRPRAFLRQLPRLLAPGGQLLLTSPFTWLEEYTPSREWLTSEEVQAQLRPEFRMARHGHLPFVIREHRRKFQLILAEVFTFIRRR